MYAIVGLGNPGSKYEYTRHNVGFMTIDYLSRLYRIKMNATVYKGLIGRGIIQGQKVILAKPQTYMNNSGECIKQILERENISIENLIVIYDDVDIAVGKLRLKPKGSAGTHNGMRSIIYNIEDDTFPRMRIGIGNPKGKMDIVKYVLGNFNKEEQPKIEEVIKRTSNSIATTILTNAQVAMSRYNG